MNSNCGGVKGDALDLFSSDTHNLREKLNQFLPDYWTHMGFLACAAMVYHLGFWWYGVIAVYCLICNNDRIVSRCDRYLLQPL